MEEDVGLTSLSEVEKNVLYAIKDLEKESGFAKTSKVKRAEFHEMIISYLLNRENLMCLFVLKFVIKSLNICLIVTACSNVMFSSNLLIVS